MIEDKLASIEDLALIVQIEQSAFPKSRWASNVAVKREFQGKGLGKLLVNRQIKLAKKIFMGLNKVYGK